MDDTTIKLFDDKKIRMKWDAKKEKWYFCIVDIVQALTDSISPNNYIKKMKSRDPLLSEGWGQIVTPLLLQTNGGKQKLNCSDIEGVFRIIQSIPSPKAEPIKMWIAKVASDRVEEIQNPELAIDRGLAYYEDKGYSKEWIKTRLQGKEARKALTDEWKRTGVKDKQYATLTDIITMEWSGFTTKAYKNYKGLKKENLRDHLTATENALNMLAEVATTELSQKRNPKNFEQNKLVAKMGGGVAKAARIDLETKLKAKVVSKENAKNLIPKRAKKDLQ